VGPSLTLVFLCVFSEGGEEYYRAFTKELGSRVVMHGVIALLVLARTDDVKEGCFEVLTAPHNTLAAGVRVVVIILV